MIRITIYLIAGIIDDTNCVLVLGHVGGVADQGYFEGFLDEVRI